MSLCEFAFPILSLIGTCRAEAEERNETGHGNSGRFEAYVNVNASVSLGTYEGLLCSNVSKIGRSISLLY